MAIQHVIERQQQVGLSNKSIFVVLRNDTPVVAYRRLEVPFVPLAEDADTYLQTHFTLQSAWDAATDMTATELRELEDQREAAGNALESRTLAEALAYIDSASTVAALRLVLKEVVKQVYSLRRVLERTVRGD